MTSRPTPDTTAEMQEKITRRIRQYVRVDASGLAPAVISHYVLGIELAAKAIAEDITPLLDATHEAACRAMRDAVIDAQTDAQSAFLIASLPLPKRGG